MFTFGVFCELKIHPSRKTQNLSKNQFIFPEPKLDLTDDDETIRETQTCVSAKTESPTNNTNRHKNQETFVEPKPMVSLEYAPSK